jgi:hypothetical protein
MARYETRFEGLTSGLCLMGIFYTLQAMLGYGDDYDDLLNFQEICLKGFRRVLEIDSLDEITKFNPYLKRKYNDPYIESDEYFPSVYSLATLAYTDSWRTDENKKMLRDSLNHINKIMKPNTNMAVKIKSKYYAIGLCALDRPIRAFTPKLIDTIVYRRPLTEMAMCSLGYGVNVLRESADNIMEALSADGILRFDKEQLKNNRKYLNAHIYPTPYADVRLETDKKRKYSLECDLTFWAVEFLKLLEEAKNGKI